MFGNNPINSHKPMITGSPSMNVGSTDLSGVDKTGKADKTGKKGGIGENVRQERAEPRRPGRRGGFKEALKTGAKLMFASMKALSVMKSRGIEKGVQFLLDQFRSILGGSTSRPGRPDVGATQTNPQTNPPSEAPQLSQFAGPLGKKPETAEDMTQLAGVLAEKPELLTPDLLKGNANAPGPSQNLKHLLDNCGKTYKELAAKDPTAAQNFRDNMVRVFDRLGGCQAGVVKSDMDKMAHPEPKELKPGEKPQTLAQQLKTYQGTYMRTQTLADMALSKIGVFTEAKYTAAMGPIKKAASEDPNMAKMDEKNKLRNNNPVTHAQAKPGHVWMEKTDAKNEFVEVPAESLFSKEEKDAFSGHYKTFVEAALDPAKLDDDMAKALGNRYKEVKNGILEALKDDTTMNQADKEKYAESLAKSSIINEVGLRVITPPVSNAAFGSPASHLSSNLLTQINILSQRGLDISGDDFRSFVTDNSKLRPTHVLGLDSLPLVQKGMNDIVDKCIALAD